MITVAERLQLTSVLSVNYCVIICRFADDLHTHLLSSSSTRSPRQVQLTLPWGVSRQRSPQPPFMFRQGDSSPSTTQRRLDGEKQSKSNQEEQMHSWGTPDETSPQPLFATMGVTRCYDPEWKSQLLRHITHTTSLVKWSPAAFLTIWRAGY